MTDTTTTPSNHAVHSARLPDVLVVEFEVAVVQYRSVKALRPLFAGHAPARYRRPPLTTAIYAAKVDRDALVALARCGVRGTMPRDVAQAPSLPRPTYSTGPTGSCALNFRAATTDPIADPTHSTTTLTCRIRLWA